MQTRQKSLIESLTNTFTGMGISFLIQLILFPLMNIPVNIHQNIIITFVFTIASIIRGYFIRRIFNRKQHC
jgi:putative Mn2+ efflux pump MntP